MTGSVNITFTTTGPHTTGKLQESPTLALNVQKPDHIGTTEKNKW